MSVEIAWQTYQIARPAKAPRSYPRALQDHEQKQVEKAAQEAIDAAKIKTFLAEPNIATRAWDIGIHKVLFCAKHMEGNEGKEVAELCWKLWEWLGVQRPFTVILWWRDDPRHIAATEWPSKSTVNGGWTHQNSTTIYIYRKEE